MFKFIKEFQEFKNIQNVMIALHEFSYKTWHVY